MEACLSDPSLRCPIAATGPGPQRGLSPTPWPGDLLAPVIDEKRQHLVRAGFNLDTRGKFGTMRDRHSGAEATKSGETGAGWSRDI